MEEEIGRPEDVGAEPQGSREDPGSGGDDYKALYEQWKNRSRDWERQAKANKSAAEELARMRKSKQGAEARVEELERRLDERERAAERAEIAARVAERKGVPARLLVGDTEEDMARWADDMLAEFKRKPAPSVDRAGSFEKGETEPSELREFARALLA